MAGAYPTGQTKPSVLLSLIRQLHPISPGREFVRLGPSGLEGDGGYLVPDDLDGIAACFSPGVSVESGFELDCARRGMDVFLADASVDGPSIDHERFVFEKRHLGALARDGFMTLESWVQGSSVDAGADLLLQMDIEGFEFEVLISSSDAFLRRFRIIVVEFHRLDLLWSRPWFDLAGVAFGRLLQSHRCVHVHPNNCCGSVKHHGIELPLAMEFTFVRSDRIGDHIFRKDFPHRLDRDNTTGPSLILPEVWYRGV